MRVSDVPPLLTILMVRGPKEEVAETKMISEPNELRCCSSASSVLAKGASDARSRSASMKGSSAIACHTRRYEEI